jgi:hypothetical protein
MSKKLVYSDYEVDVLDNQLTIKGNIQPQRLLLVTNVTKGIIIYNFADPSLGYTNYTYNDNQEFTTYDLKADLDALGAEERDVYQVFIEEDHAKVEFSEVFVDPVNKLRVSNPGNLIDTDFEYGLQGTKWETLQTVQNIPTIYSSSGDVPLEGLESINTTANSKVIRVVLSIDADIKLGDPIVVQGVTLSLAEGAFLITGISGTREFFYEIDQAAPRTEVISGAYTTIIQAKFFEGAALSLDESDGLGIVTDGLSPSIVKVFTPEVHGLNPRTKIYLRNTVGPKVLNVVDPTATAPDGRPFIDLSASLTNTQSIDSTLQTNRSGYLEFPVVTWDWESTYNKYLSPADIIPFETGEAATTSIINWPTHGFLNNYCLVFQAQVRGQTTGGMLDGTVYYVKVVDVDNIQLCTDYGTLANLVQLTSLDTTKGHPRLSLCYKVEQKDSTQRFTPFFTRNNTVNTNGITRGESNIASVGQRTAIIDITSTYGTGRIPWAFTLSRVDFNGNRINSAGVWSYYGDNSPTGRRAEYRFGARGVTSGTDFPNTNLINAVFQGNGSTYLGLATQAGRYYFTILLVPDSSLLAFDKFGNTGERWAYTLYFSGQHRPSTLNFNHSGSDFNGRAFGLGGSQSNAIVAFQSRTPDTAYTTNLDAYSALPNQRTNGRYGTGSFKYNNNVVSTDTFGSFNTNYTDAGVQTFIGDNTHVYYMFANNLPANFRNSVYYAAHGFTNNDLVEITVTNYTTSNRFEFVDTTGTSRPIAAENFQARITVITDDLFRIQPQVAPNTDDISNYPNQFVITVSKLNPLFNSVYIANHKITSVTEAVVNAGVGATLPSPLTNGGTFRVARRNDNRVFFKSASGGGATAVTSPIGNTSNSASFWDVNIQDPLGLDPQSATITKVEYRGDLSDQNEFLTLTFYKADGTTVDSTFNIARVAPKADTATFLTSSNWVAKDISQLLRVVGSKKTFRLRVAPTSAVNFVVPGMSNWWELRFTIQASSEDIVLSTQGSGSFEVRLSGQPGAYDGTYSIVEVPSDEGGKSFTVQLPFEVPKREYSIPAAQIDTANDIITTSLSGIDHNLLLGEKIEYDRNGNTAVIIDEARYVIPITSTSFRLATSVADAEAGNFVQISAPSGTHIFRTSNVIKGQRGGGLISATVNSRHFSGVGTKFLVDFKTGDPLYTFVGGRMRKFTVREVSTDVEIFVEETIVANTTSQPYYIKTTVNLRPDGYNLHKSFDGGVDITAGTSPNSKIVRQSRKYFRYQSGKGIQNSFAANFSPAKILAKLTYNSNDNKITCITQEAHNLSLNDPITIQGAEVNEGTNFFNGEFLVSEIPDPFSFKVASAGAMLQSIASGFPEYYRNEWRDSFVRAGMFDDQNGFYFEYDGQDIACVRRSSTLQLSGVINVINKSQVVEGINTSFTGQLEVGDKIVIRGMSYKVVAIDSDSRLVVQPPYRGRTATQVKLTKTVDVKVSRENFSIDKADGTGPSGFIFNPHKLQMAYADYSWYGAGKIRFGFKDRFGKVFYFHEFIHNNRLNESYFRSGNLPARYEIENGNDPTSAPTLFHFGTSVIMDGRFDDDGAYKFAATSKPFVFANGATGTLTNGAVTEFEQITLRGKRVFVYSIPVTEANALRVQQGQLIRDATNVLPRGTYITQVKVLGANSRIYTSYPATSVFPDPGTFGNIASGITFTYGEFTATDLTRPLPLVSFRLAPSVDSSLVGFLGEREIINRMQIILDAISVTSNKEVDIFLVLNSSPSNLNFDNIGTPSLSQFIDHNTGDTITGGVTLYSSKVSANTTGEISLRGLIDLGNSILGGDGIFPSGPDLLTLLVQPTNTVGISGTSPFIVSGKISWSESQA